MKQANGPIDFVILWVDGSDPAWQAEKNRYLEQTTGKAASIDAGEARYRDWDNLRYWFRAVEQYAPWVNRVHFVTCGQVPQWLNLNHPKLHFVQHKDFIPAEYLPTFSSHPIELNLHRIPGLSEQFVYFNDDFFLTAPVRPEDFFQKSLPCDSLEESPMIFREDTVMNSIWVNNIRFVNRHFRRRKCRTAHPGKWFSLRDPRGLGKNLLFLPLGHRDFFGLRTHHLPQAYLKQTLQQVWQAEPELLHQTCLRRFRSERDISQYIFKFWQLLTGSFAPCGLHRAGRMFVGGENMDALTSAITKQRYKYICINDTTEDYSEIRQQVIDAFETVLPERSGFEKYTPG